MVKIDGCTNLVVIFTIAEINYLVFRSTSQLGALSFRIYFCATEFFGSGICLGSCTEKKGVLPFPKGVHSIPIHSLSYFEAKCSF